MRLTKRQLKRIIREEFKRRGLVKESFENLEAMMKPGPSHSSKGECPSHYDWSSLYNIAKSMRISGYGEPPTRFLKAWNRYKNKKGYNIPGMLYDEVPECAYAIIEAAARGGDDMSAEAYQAVCDAWMQDADSYSEFSWNYDPDSY